MHDILDVIKNVQALTENNNNFSILKDFESVLDSLDIYVFKNWSEGELIKGPEISRYSVTCSFMWSSKEMPDPEGAKRLGDYGCKVLYKKDHIMIPRKIKDPDDFRPGTKKGKIDPHSIWVVTITMPKKLMQDVGVGKDNKNDNYLTSVMKYETTTINSPNAPGSESSNEQI